MSYFFDGSNENLVGVATTAIDDTSAAVTLACYSRITTHPAAIDIFLQLNTNLIDNEQMMYLGTGPTVDTYYFARDNTSTTPSNASVTKTGVSDVWVPHVAVQNVGGVGADHYVADQVTNSVVTRLIGAMTHIWIGTNVLNSQDMLGWIAEVAVWNIALSAGQIVQYQTGTPASSIAAANLRLYYPLSTDSGAGPIPNLGLDAGGDLTITGANWDALHPSIAGGSSIVAIAHRLRTLRNSANG